ncbi:hypothetical protein [Mycoplasmopsis iners]|uniref:hypothetical protein n=1 Tax=Mycoplasmopsis iners TaxID=76630 RepID=UPI0004955E50|nr:hypothetical protein [Mycoplasmopsis iners]
MKKANIKTKTIFWLILLIAAIIALILCSIIISNAEFILRVYRDYAVLPQEMLSNARVERSYAIGGVALSIVIILMGSYICYAGFKSWNYNAIL